MCSALTSRGERSTKLLILLEIVHELLELVRVGELEPRSALECLTALVVQIRHGVHIRLDKVVGSEEATDYQYPIYDAEHLGAFLSPTNFAQEFIILLC